MLRARKTVQWRLYIEMTPEELNDYLESMVEIPRIKVGERQTIETLINEEALLFAMYLRDEKHTWNPRIM